MIVDHMQLHRGDGGSISPIEMIKALHATPALRPVTAFCPNHHGRGAPLVMVWRTGDLGDLVSIVRMAIHVEGKIDQACRGGRSKLPMERQLHTWLRRELPGGATVDCPMCRSSFTIEVDILGRPQIRPT